MTRDDVAELYRRYGFFLLRRCRLILRDEAAARDALQETFVKLMTHGATMQETERPMRWLSRVAERCCFDAMRKNRKLQMATPLETIQDDVGAHPSVDPVVRNAVLSVLGRMSEEEQQIAVLAFDDGMSQGEIAEELGYSRVTINKRLQGIRERAQRVMGGKDG